MQPSSSLTLGCNNADTEQLGTRSLGTEESGCQLELSMNVREILKCAVKAPTIPFG